MNLNGQVRGRVLGGLILLSSLLVVTLFMARGAWAAGLTPSEQPISPAALGMRLGPLLPDLIGMNGPVTYLILVQNNDELRATGGFISAVGTLRLENARIAELDFVDSYAFFSRDLAYPPAPPPMQRYMDIPLLLLRDANWSPDLPTTARLVQALHHRETGLAIDGIITIDLRAVELIISALEPLQIEGAEETITGATVVEQIKELYSVPASLDANIETAGLGAWWRARKEFIPVLAQGARSRLESGDVDLFKLITAAQTALSERAIQVWLAQPAAQAEMAELGWDGGLHPGPGADFLALVDTNMGYNKVDAVIERQLDYAVSWPDGAGKPAQATVTVTYTHPLSVTDELCEPTPRYGASYEDMTLRCYFDYVRIYAPAGSKLVEMTGVEPDSVKTQRGEGKTQLFAGYFTLQPGQQQVVTVRYSLPPELTPRNYALVVQRQSGSGPLPLSITVDGASWSGALAEGRLRWAP